jgi:hypothetical protein
LLHHRAKFLSQRQRRLGQVFRHQILSRGIDQIAHQVDGGDLTLNPVGVAGRIQRPAAPVFVAGVL